MFLLIYFIYFQNYPFTYFSNLINLISNISIYLRSLYLWSRLSSKEQSNPRQNTQREKNETTHKQNETRSKEQVFVLVIIISLSDSKRVMRLNNNQYLICLMHPKCLIYCLNKIQYKYF
jgi:hypothetical protein